jgi:hypothetical protein
MMKRVAMSKMFQCIFVAAIISGVVVGASQPTIAGNFPARSGKSDYPASEPNCWAPNGPTIQNICPQGKYWYVPLVNAGVGRFWLTVTAEAANNSSNVQCISTGANRDGTGFIQSGWFSLSQFGVAANINLDTTIPSGGTGEADCYALPGGKLHTVSW